MGVSSLRPRWPLEPLCVSATSPPAAILAQFGLPWRASVTQFPDGVDLDGPSVRMRSEAIAIEDGGDQFPKQTVRASSAGRLKSAQICGEGPACL
jgi:hypothetical protein